MPRSTAPPRSRRARRSSEAQHSLPFAQQGPVEFDWALLFYGVLLSDNPLPKISCLLVTAKGRLEYLRRSYQCYLDQTYSNRELVIVNEGPPEYQQQIKSLVAGRADVRLIFLRGDYTLGALRNISIALCGGDLFVQWDDDDFNMPSRLLVQYNYLIRSGARCCYLGDQLHYYFPTRELYWENWAKFQSNALLEFSLIPGTLMAHRQEFVYRYPSSGKLARAGEDSVLAHDLCHSTEVALLQNQGTMQIYSYHGGNVWDLEHHLHISRQRSMDRAYMIRHREIICRTLAYMQFDNVRVMGRDGLAYIYEGSNAL